jgi:hypothetical protein
MLDVSLMDNNDAGVENTVKITIVNHQQDIIIVKKIQLIKQRRYLFDDFCENFQ